MVQGHRSFKDYSVFMRAMAVALSGYEGDHVTIFSIGPLKINQFASEFCNVSENGMIARGKRIVFVRRPYNWAKDNIHTMNYVAYFAGRQKVSPEILKLANEADVENGLFKYPGKG